MVPSGMSFLSGEILFELSVCFYTLCVSTVFTVVFS